MGRTGRHKMAMVCEERNMLKTPMQIHAKYTSFDLPSDMLHDF